MADRFVFLIDYGPILLRRPFRSHFTVGTLPSGVLATGQRGITPAFGYDAPHLSVRGTLTLLIYALPSAQYGLLRLLTRLPLGFHFFSLYHSLRRVWAVDRVRPLLFHRLLSTMRSIANIPFSLRRRILRGCLFRFFTASLAFTFADRLGSLLFPFRG